MLRKGEIMADLKLFLRGNKKSRGTTKYAATSTLCDEKGNPLEWEIKPLTTAENDEIREACTYEVQVVGKPNMFRTKVNTSKYIAMMIARSVVFPDLNNTELQDSYGVMTPEELVKAMVDIPSEYDEFATFIQTYNGFDTSLDDKVAEAKN